MTIVHADDSLKEAPIESTIEVANQESSEKNALNSSIVASSIREPGQETELTVQD